MLRKSPGTTGLTPIPSDFWRVMHVKSITYCCRLYARHRLHCTPCTVAHQWTLTNALNSSHLHIKFLQPANRIWFYLSTTRSSCYQPRLTIHFFLIANRCSRYVSQISKNNTQKYNESQICFYYRAMHFSAKRGIAIACRLSVRLSVCL